MFTGNTNLGKPGIMNLLMAVISVVCFIVPALWAKRLNLFICAFNLAWAVRNFLLVTQCQMGECPEKKAGIYAMLLLSALMMVMAMFPKVKLKENFS